MVSRGSIRELGYRERPDDLRSGEILTVENPRFTVPTAQPQNQNIRSGALFLEVLTERIPARQKSQEVVRFEKPP